MLRSAAPARVVPLKLVSSLRSSTTCLVAFLHQFRRPDVSVHKLCPAQWSGIKYSADSKMRQRARKEPYKYERHRRVNGAFHMTLKIGRQIGFWLIFLGTYEPGG